MDWRDVIKQIEQDGWRLDRQKGSHKIYTKEGFNGQITISAHNLSEQIGPRMKKLIENQAGFKLK